MKNILKPTTVGVELLYPVQDAPIPLPTFKIPAELFINSGFTIGESVLIYSDKNNIILMRNG